MLSTLKQNVKETQIQYSWLTLEMILFQANFLTLETVNMFAAYNLSLTFTLTGLVIPPYQT